MPPLGPFAPTAAIGGEEGETVDLKHPRTFNTDIL